MKAYQRIYQDQYQQAWQRRRGTVEKLRQQLTGIEEKADKVRARWNDQWNQVQVEKKRIEWVIEGLQEKLNGQQQVPEDSMLLQANGQEQRSYAEAEAEIKDLTSQQLHMQSQQNQAKAAIRKLNGYSKQTMEEMNMTEEDVAARLLKKAELVAQREELEHMLEQSKHQAGREFELYLFIFETPSQTSELQMKEYEHLKNMSFYLSVLTSLKSECSSSEKYKLIEDECLRALN